MGSWRNAEQVDIASRTVLYSGYDMVLIIGYGNSLRRDDGAGPELLRMIREDARSDDIHTIEVHQLVPELAGEMASPDISAVLFFDASVATIDADGQDSGNKVELGKLDGVSAIPCLGHYFAPSMLLKYTELIYGRKPPAWLVSIPGEDFGFGEGFSETARSSLAVARQMVLELLDLLRSDGLFRDNLLYIQ